MHDAADPTIYVCAPARACVTGEESNEIDEALIEKAFDEIRALGWRVKVSSNVRKLDHGFAGSDEVRAQALMQGFADPEVDIVLALRGGYGTARILPFLDWEQIGKSEAVFAGLSDLTAFNLALYAKCGRASWQGPTARAFARKNRLYNERFMRAMTQTPFVLDSDAEGKDFDAQGIFWGGNLTILLSLLGTPWFPQIDGGILVVEDVYVTAWRFERMLVQLLQSGVLSRQKALIVGDVSGHDAGLGGPNSGLSLEDVLAYIAKEAQIPVVRGLDYGHKPDTLTIPVGARAQAFCEDRRLHLEFDAPPVPAEYPGAPSARAPLWWV